jgi:acyl-CoA thioesterase I
MFATLEPRAFTKGQLNIESFLALSRGDTLYAFMSSFRPPKRTNLLRRRAWCLLASLAAIPAAWSAPVVWNESAPVKVACVGGSVTAGYWGDLVLQRKTYPDQLQKLLGPGYQLRNCGVSGATGGCYPGWEWRAFINQGEQVGMIKWQPDVIVAGLGVNDCFPTFADPARYEQGYRDLAASWRAQGRSPALWIWNHFTPDFRGPVGVPAYPGNIFAPRYIFPTDDDGLSTIRPTLQQRVDQFASSLGAGTIDAYTELADKAAWGGDGVHLTELGLKRLAEIVYCQAFGARAFSGNPVLSETAPSPDSDSLPDETGTSYPWLELHNPLPHAICLDGMALDRGAGSPRFVFSDLTVLGADERRIVFLSGKSLRDPARNLHANFTVEGAEGQIRLISRSGELADMIGWKNWTAPGSLGRATPQMTSPIGTMSFHQRLVTSNPPAGWNQLGFNAGGWTGGLGGAGYELGAKAEEHFTKRWDCTSQSTSTWSLQQPSSGVWNVLGGFATCRGTGGVASVPQWIQGDDLSWTVEVRVRLTGSQEFLIRGGTQGVGGGNSHLYILSRKVLLGYPAIASHVLSTEPNDDAFHVFRMAYHAPTRRFFVWRDGVEISSKTGGNSADASRYHWLTIGAASSAIPVDAVIDYASYDTTGAYRPEINYGYRPGPADAMPLVTDIISPAPVGSEASTLVRIPFSWDGGAISGMKLKLEFDDGFRVWINGEEVANCNAPDGGNAATADRDNSVGTSSLTLDLGAFANLISTGNNLLALQVFNSNSNDGRCFIRASLEIANTVSSSARYFFPPTAGQPNGVGTNLPAQGWLIGDQPSTGGGSQALPLLLELDSDGDGRSNLLEYSQGTNVGVPDAAPVLQAVQNRVTFGWRDNPDVGWRLMESSDQQVWRPVTTTGSPELSTGSAGMLSISQPVAGGSGFSYRLAAVEQPTLANWRLRYFTSSEISNGVITDPDADPDGDMLPNFLEFSIASDPKKMTCGLVVPNGRFIAFPDVGTGRGAAWTLQSSPDMKQWNIRYAPELRCTVDPVSGLYRLEAMDTTLPTDKGFQRIGFTKSNP